MIFVVPQDTSAGFKYVDSLGDIGKQYVTLSSPGSKDVVLKAYQGKRVITEVEEDEDHYSGAYNMAGLGGRGKRKAGRGKGRGRH